MPDWFDSAINSPYTIGAAIALILAACILWILTRPPKRFKAFDSEGGEVFVTRRAVRELVRKCCEELGDVGSASPHIRVHNGLVSVNVELRVRKRANLKGISGYLREQISNVLTLNLGLEELGEIGIVVVGILDDPDTDED